MTQITSGSCQCGSVRFEVAGPFEAFFLCHCRRCRKDTGSAHAANLFSSSATLRWVSGQASIRIYCVPGTRHEKGFCTSCGSAVPCIQDNGAVLMVPAGSLDSDIDIRPMAHICVEDRAEWDAGLEAVPEMRGMPG